MVMFTGLFAVLAPPVPPISWRSRSALTVVAANNAREIRPTRLISLHHIFYDAVERPSGRGLEAHVIASRLRREHLLAAVGWEAAAIGAERPAAIGRAADDVGSAGAAVRAGAFSDGDCIGSVCKPGKIANVDTFAGCPCYILITGRNTDGERGLRQRISETWIGIRSGDHPRRSGLRHAADGVGARSERFACCLIELGHPAYSAYSSSPQSLPGDRRAHVDDGDRCTGGG